MKRNQKILRAFLPAALAGSLLMGGCASSSTPEGSMALSLMIAPAANSAGINLNTPQIQQEIFDTAKNYGYISCVIADGNPEVGLEKECTEGQAFSKGSDTVKNRIAQEVTDQLSAEIMELSVNDEELDILRGLQLCARSLSASQKAVKSLVVVSSGLATTGILNFQNNLLSASPADIVAELSARNELPNLQDVKVTWFQMGETASPQQPLSSDAKSRLTDIWRAVIEASGGTFTAGEGMPGSALDSSLLPYVSVVDVPEQNAIAFETSETDFQTPARLDPEKLRFLPDSAQFADEASAMQVLEPVAQILISNPDIQVYVIGGTAGDENTDYALQLSMERALRVSESLQNLGVDASQLHALGLGADQPGHIYGAGTETDSGSLAASNRAVVIMNADALQL